MTDKKIIIHGEQVPVITLTRHQLEEDWYNLHEQLQCKEQECEHRESELIEANNQVIYLVKQLEEKEQECEELKTEVVSLRESGKKSCAYCADYIAKEKENNSYKQALEKIEEILKFYANSTVGVKNIDGTFSLKNEQEAIILNYSPKEAQRGLDIINEVKEC